MNTDRLNPVDLVVSGNLLIDGQPRTGHILVRDGRILDVELAREASAPIPAAQHIDAGENLILPGAVDAHVHSYSHTGEGFLASTSAAAAGGVTTIIEMPFDGTGPIGDRDRLLRKQDLVGREAVIDVALLGTLLPDGGWRGAEQLVSEGVVGFKASLFDTDAFRFPRTSDAELLDVMRTISELGSTLCVHAENNEIIKARLSDEGNRQSTDPGVHARTRPPVAETTAILTAMEIAATESSALHLCHLSLARSAELLRWYRNQGVDVTFESCPHYLNLTEADMTQARGQLKINPPLRTSGDQQAMWNAVTSGLAPIVASDHAPWPMTKKNADVILDNASGVPGVQLLVPLTLGPALQRYGFGSELAAVVASMTSGPAARYGIDHRKGTLAPGMDADLMIVAIDASWEVTVHEQLSNAAWTPYEHRCPGVRVETTISRGDVVWSRANGRSGQPGRGTIIRRR